MISDNTLKQRISLEVIKVLFSRFQNFPENSDNNRNAPFHEAFLNAFADKFNDKISDIPYLISLSSWLHGLNTTLGQTFFENVAHILSNGDKREYTSKRSGNLKVSETQQSNRNNIITDLSNSTRTPDLEIENQLIFNDDEVANIVAMDFSADVFIEDDRDIIAIEMKTVKPNSGELKGEKEKILEGKAALHKKFPNKNIKFYLGFPFDPTSNESIEYDKERFIGSVINLQKYFDPNEILLAEELWDLLSGSTGTMQFILDIINQIATPEFIEIYNYINDRSNLENNFDDYKAALLEWNLFDEIYILDNIVDIRSIISANSNLGRTFRQRIFRQKGKYNYFRVKSLKEALQEYHDNH